NDGTAGGAIAAMKGNGVDPTKIPTTGQDAELAAIQRILAGEQYMTVYKPIKPEAEKAAELAVALAKGDTPPAAADKVNNGTKDVPSILLNPVVARTHNTKDNNAAQPVFGHSGQHQRHDREGRVLVGGRDLHRQVRGGLQEGWHSVGPVGNNAG